MLQCRNLKRQAFLTKATRLHILVRKQLSFQFSLLMGASPPVAGHRSLEFLETERKNPNRLGSLPGDLDSIGLP